MIQGHINTAVDDVTHCIINAADMSIPKSSGLPKKHSKPWWNEDCKIAKKKHQKAWGIFRHYPTTSNYISYKDRGLSKCQENQAEISEGVLD